MKNSQRGFIAVVMFFLITAVSADAVQRLVLFENQTNTSCPNCPPADQLIDQLVQQYGEYFAVVTYHAWWPGVNDPYYQYNINENTARINYYPPEDGYRYTPYGFVDGVFRGYNYNQWLNWLMARYDEPSPMEINLNGSYNQDTRQGNLHVTIHATDPITMQGLKVRIALTESEIYWIAPNGVRYHNFTMRDMIPSATGLALNISQGQTMEFDQDFSVPSESDINECAIIAWVQADNSGYEVLQAARSDVLALSPVGIDDNVASLPEGFNLAQNYPNPFNVTTGIEYTLAVESQVKLEVYDLVGRKVADLATGVQPAGNHQIIWDGQDSRGRVVASGVYFYRLTAGDRSMTRRMMLLK